jgi:hypothetical protein
VLQEIDNLMMVVALPKKQPKSEMQMTDRSERLERGGELAGVNNIHNLEAKLMSLRQNSTF